MHESDSRVVLFSWPRRCVCGCVRSSFDVARPDVGVRVFVFAHLRGQVFSLLRRQIKESSRLATEATRENYFVAERTVRQ